MINLNKKQIDLIIKNNYSKSINNASTVKKTDIPKRAETKKQPVLSCSNKRKLFLTYSLKH